MNAMDHTNIILKLEVHSTDLGGVREQMRLLEGWLGCFQTASVIGPVPACFIRLRKKVKEWLEAHPLDQSIFSKDNCCIRSFDEGAPYDLFYFGLSKPFIGDMPLKTKDRPIRTFCYPADITYAEYINCTHGTNPLACYISGIPECAEVRESLCRRVESRGCGLCSYYCKTQFYQRIHSCNEETAGEEQSSSAHSQDWMTDAIRDAFRICDLYPGGDEFTREERTFAEAMVAFDNKYRDLAGIPKKEETK